MEESNEESQFTPKEGLIQANHIILKIMEEIPCPLCDEGEDNCVHTDYIEISTLIQSLIAKLNRN